MNTLYKNCIFKQLTPSKSTSTIALPSTSSITIFQAENKNLTPNPRNFAFNTIAQQPLSLSQRRRLPQVGIEIKTMGTSKGKKIDPTEQEGVKMHRPGIEPGAGRII